MPSPSPGGDGDPGSGRSERSRFAGSLLSFSEVPRGLVPLGQSMLLAVILLLLILFPSELFNRTLEENYEEVLGWFGPIARVGSRMLSGLGRSTNKWVGFGVFSGLVAVLYAFVDPQFGLNRGSLALLLGLGLGIMATTVLFDLPMALYMRRRYGERANIRVLTAAILIAVVCVAISRLLNFLPGYFYGIVAAFTFNREMNKEDAGRTVAWSSVVMLGVAFAAWIAWIPVANVASKPGASTAILVLDALLVALFVCGVEGVVFGLFPMRFMDGHKLRTWNGLVWAILFLMGIFTFVHILIRGNVDYVGSSSTIPILIVMVLFGGFALASVAFWAYFRYRRPRPAVAAARGSTITPDDS